MKRPSCLCTCSFDGRDLYDLAPALKVCEGLRLDFVVVMFGRHLGLSGQTNSRAQAQKRVFAKLANPRFLLDLRPLLPAAQVEALTEEATAGAFAVLVDRIPGEAWAQTPPAHPR